MATKTNLLLMAGAALLVVAGLAVAQTIDGTTQTDNVSSDAQGDADVAADQPAAHNCPLKDGNATADPAIQARGPPRGR